MKAPVLEGLIADVRRLLAAGAAPAGGDEALRRRAAALRRSAASVPALARLADAAEAAGTAPPEQGAQALLDLALLVRPVRDSLAVTGLPGAVTPLADARSWATPLPAREALALRDELASKPRPACARLTRAVAAHGGLDLRLVGPAVKAAVTAYATTTGPLPDWLHAVVPEVEALGPESAVGTGERPGLLPRLGGEAALRACRAALTSDNPAVRGQGAFWLAQLAPAAEALERLLPLLGGPEREGWAPAAVGLSGLGAAAVPALLRRLREPTCERGASLALDRMARDGKDRAVIDALTPHLPALLDTLPGAAAETLDNLLRVIYYLRPAPSQVSPLLVALLDRFTSKSEDDRRRRDRLLWALGVIGVSSEAELDRVAAVARHDPSSHVRELAGYALQELADSYPRAVFLLVECLTEGERYCPAVHAIGYLGRKVRPALPRLAELVEHDNLEVRLAALQALTRLGAAGLAAAPAVLRAARKGPEEVRQAALGVVARLGPAVPEFADVLRAALRDPNKAVRAAGAQMIGEMRTKAPDVVPLLVELANGEDAGVRARALGRLKAFALRVPDALAALTAALADSEPQVCYAAVNALAGVRPKSEVTVPPPLKALQSDNVSVRETAAQALGWLGPLARPAVPALTRALADPERRVQLAAELALQRIQGANGKGH
jgi:HEAT repeat protein